MTDELNAAIVSLDAPELAPRRAIGDLRRVRSRSRTAISFAYRQGWVSGPEVFEIDPLLRLYEGEQYARGGDLPGIFADTAPDRWGRMLLERREAAAARREGRAAHRLDDWDFLVEVEDALRMGALRLSRSAEGPYLHDGPPAVPPIARLRELEFAARELERTSSLDADDEASWLALLLAPGSSLGGARPKANFTAEDDSLWISKFPSRADREDVGAWEYLVTSLAQRGGVDVPETRLLRLTVEYRTFCAKRFDRIGSDRRMFASGMTLTGKRDGEEASYLDLALAIQDHGASKAINEDLEQLFRRLVFNILVANRDDHLRNHGFLRSNQGWRLSPAFDLNPMPRKPEHTLAIDDRIRTPDLALVLETAPFYRLSSSRATAIVSEMKDAIRPWRRLARELELPNYEIELMAQGFSDA